MKVGVIGVGSIGSAACEQLVMYGLRDLALVDPDHVRPHNIARMRLPASTIGRRKVSAVAEHLREGDSNVRVLALPLDVMQQADYLRPLLREMDAILVCTDGVEPRPIANHLAVRGRVPAVFACVLEDGALGEVLRSRARPAACSATAQSSPSPAAWIPSPASISATGRARTTCP
jgi:molybdopterin/thiamine biosynthesis adenylyltransferase